MNNINDKKKIALVLSGGGIKAAAFHIGVCLAIKEKGFKFAGGDKTLVDRNFQADQPMTIRLYVGSSAGAFISAILSAGYSLESLVNAFDIGGGHKPHFSDHSLGVLRPIRYKDLFSINSQGMLKTLPRFLLNKPLFSGGIEALIKEKFKLNGIFTTQGIEKYLHRHALSHNEFAQLGVQLFIIGTQLNHSRKVIFGNFPQTRKNDFMKYVHYAKISEAVAASTSLPPVYSPYCITSPEGKDMYYFDGEIRDTLSTHVAADHGADLVISSYSIQPYHYNKEVGSLHQYGMPAIINQALYQVVQQKIDRHIKHQSDMRSIYTAIDGYFKSTNLEDSHREKILKIISDRVNYKSSVDYIYIHPKAQNHEFFFADHFSLNTKILEHIVFAGFKATISELRKYNL